MLTLTRRRGIGGAIKQSPEDFVVKEITGRGVALEPGTKYDAKSLGEEEVLEGKQISFVLEKRELEHSQRAAHHSEADGQGQEVDRLRRREGQEGANRAAGERLPPRAVRHVIAEAEGHKHKRLWRSNGVELGSDLGNAFDIRIGTWASRTGRLR